MKSTNSLIARIGLVAAACASLGGCATTLGGGVVVGEIGDIAEVEVIAASGRVTDGASSSPYLPPPTGSATAGVAGAMVSGLLTGIDQAANKREREFLDRVAANLPASVIQSRIALAVRSQDARGPQAFGAKAVSAHADKPGSPKPPAAKLRISFRHGLGMNDTPLLTPKAYATIEYSIAGRSDVVSQRLLFVGTPPQTLSVTWEQLATWWMTNNRYETFVDNAITAVAAQVVWALRVDPARSSQDVRDQVLRLSAEVNRVDAISDECSVNGDGAKIVLRFYRRVADIASAAQCQDPQVQRSGSPENLMQWSFDRTQE